mgnify:FL=1
MIEYNTYCCEDLLTYFGLFGWVNIENEMGELCWTSPFIHNRMIKYCPFCGKRILGIELPIENFKDKINGKNKENPGAVVEDAR